MQNTNLLDLWCDYVDFHCLDTNLVQLESIKYSFSSHFKHLFEKTQVSGASILEVLAVSADEGLCDAIMPTANKQVKYACHVKGSGIHSAGNQ